MNSQGFFLSDPVEVVDVPAFVALCTAAEMTMPKIPEFIEEASTRLAKIAETKALVVNGPGTFIYSSSKSGEAGHFRLTMALPIAGDENLGLATDDSLSQVLKVGAFHCCQIQFKGPMQYLGEAYPHFIDKVKAAGHQPQNESREIFHDWQSWGSSGNIITLQIAIT